MTTGAAQPRTSNKLVRVCLALSTTQLLPLIHILRREPYATAETILLWHTQLMSEPESAANLMTAVIQSYPFAATYRLVGLRNAKQSPQLSIARRFLEYLRNHFYDARSIRTLLAPHLTGNYQLEIWTDEPIHFPTTFLHALYPNAVHVKFPHAFNLEDKSSSDSRNRMLSKSKSSASLQRKFLWLLTRFVTRVHYTERTALTFDRAYTFGATSEWSPHSVDCSTTITVDRMREAYELLPHSLKRDVEQKLNNATMGYQMPWLLVLLFGVDEGRKLMYRAALKRIRNERPELFDGRLLVLKPHPLTFHSRPRELASELSSDLSLPVGIFECPLNIDILWHLLPAQIVLAGPCGALPIMRKIGIGTPYIIRELWDEIVTLCPAEAKGHQEVIEDAPII